MEEFQLIPTLYNYESHFLPKEALNFYRKLLIYVCIMDINRQD